MPPQVIRLYGHHHWNEHARDGHIDEVIQKSVLPFSRMYSERERAVRLFRKSTLLFEAWSCSYTANVNNTHLQFIEIISTIS